MPRTASQTLKVGDTAPDFTLKTGNREDWHPQRFSWKKERRAGLCAFRFSSVCSAQLPSYEAELGRFNDLDTEVVSVSMDSGFALAAWAKSMSTSFPLLSDFSGVQSTSLS